MVTSKYSVHPLYVYSQAFGKDWVTVGAYFRGVHGQPAKFKYAPSYLERTDCVSIDPVNLPLLNSDHVFPALRYDGLHDVLRDACPDSWGRKLLIQYRGLTEKSTPLDFLKATDNSDRWGALAVGTSKTANLSQMLSPKITNLEQVIAELQAIEKGSLAINSKLRERLVQTGSGGARPKATVQDNNQAYWLLKPQSIFDLPQSARLENFAQKWGAAIGLRFSETEFFHLPSLIPAVRVKRFDRANGYRKMCLSAASVLKYEFPPTVVEVNQKSSQNVPSYPGLAAQMRLIGCPDEDRIELFRRMIFNMICGNDDDHARNHALVYEVEEHQWRLSPAYDVVPSQSGAVSHLGMAISKLDKRITRENILSGFDQFGFKTSQEADHVLQETFHLAKKSYALCKDLLDENTQVIIKRQMESAEKTIFDGANVINKGRSISEQEDKNDSCSGSAEFKR